MAIQFLRGNTAENDAYTGPVGSITVDTELGNMRIHDGVNPGGWTIANVDELGNINSISGSSPVVISGTVADPVIEIQASTQTQNGYMSSVDKAKLDGVESGAEVNAVDSVNGQTGAVVIPDADASNSGLMSTSDQTFSGNKTFSGVVTINEGRL